MSNEPIHLPALFPDLPRELPVIGENGDFNPLWSLGLSSLFQALQENYKNEGILFPKLSADNIANIQAVYTPYIGLPLPTNIPDISGQTVFDIDNRVPKQFIITYDTSSPPIVLSAQWLIMNVMLFSAGSPNGQNAGVVGWFCYDLTNKVLYICTTSGSTTGAVWTAV